MKQLIKFVIVGVLNTILGYSVIFGCMYILGMDPVISNVVGYLIGLMLSYTLNRKVTFQSTSKSKSEVVRFLIVFLIAYFANLAVLMILINVGVFHEVVNQIVAGAVYVVFSFFLNKYYVFYRSS
ncbi:GtrA family protein [Pseudomonas sp. KK4]|uniref:GtrA family protein n=1 Tax=Pseudomonas sp. KK4 TaxID=1855729 RepID=UPI00097C6485